MERLTRHEKLTVSGNGTPTPMYQSPRMIALARASIYSIVVCAKLSLISV